ncbi:MAG: decaprenyl-phosphate phosphoribosyltransferase [Eubacteriales bacterium]|nr:decaprenyl-phosphate phosphoribosyltransferase [Eubacteriales bacterium]
MRKYLRLMRMHHYLKNLLVLAPLVFSGRMLEPALLRQTAVGFVAFCLLSSAAYIINDLRDVERDRAHPVKRNRPIASGAVSERSAKLLAAVLLLAAASLQVFAGLAGMGLACMLLYLAVNLGYSFGLKNFPIVDIFCLAAGFLLRLLYGSIITGIEVSGWLYLTVISVSFYFALGKRRNELIRLGTDGSTRRVLSSYTRAFLDKNMYMFLGLLNVFYALWCMENPNRTLLFTVPVVMLICMKYSLDVEGDSDGDPVEVLVHDKVLIALCGLYALGMLAILYLAKLTA